MLSHIVIQKILRNVATFPSYFLKNLSSSPLLIKGRDPMTHYSYRGRHTKDIVERALRLPTAIHCSPAPCFDVIERL